MIIYNKVTTSRRYDNGTEDARSFYPHYKLQAKYLPVREDALCEGCRRFFKTEVDLVKLRLETIGKNYSNVACE